MPVKEPFHTKDFKWKKYGDAGLIYGKTEASYAELNEKAKTVTSSYFVTSGFLHSIYSMLVTKNHQKFRSRCLVHEFPSQIFFNDINLDTEQQYWRKIICGCFRFTWMWLFISIMKRCAEWCALQLYHTSLKKVSVPVMKCHIDRCVHHFCKLKVNFSEIHVKSDHHGFNICYNFIIFNWV